MAPAHAARPLALLALLLATRAEQALLTGGAPQELLPAPHVVREGGCDAGGDGPVAACQAPPSTASEPVLDSPPLRPMADSSPLARPAAEAEVARERRAEAHLAAARSARKESTERAEEALRRLRALLERLGNATDVAGRVRAAAEGARHAYGGVLVVARKAFGERLAALSLATVDQPLQQLVERAIEAAHEVQRMERGRANEMRHLLTQMWKEEKLQVRIVGKEAKEAAEEALQMFRHEESAQMMAGDDEEADQRVYEEKEPSVEGLRDKAVILRELAEEMVEDYYRQARRSVEDVADSIKESAKHQVAAMVREIREASEMVLKQKAVAQAARTAARSLQREAATLEREAAALGEDAGGASEAAPSHSGAGRVSQGQSWLRDWAPALASLGALLMLLSLPLLLATRRLWQATEVAAETEAEAEAAPPLAGQEVLAGPTLIEKRVLHTRHEVKVTVIPTDTLVPEACSTEAATQPLAG